MLSNFETSTQKLMHIVLAGPAEAGREAGGSGLEATASARFDDHPLDPFTPEETEAYIDWRSAAAGYQGPPIFMADAIERFAA